MLKGKKLLILSLVFFVLLNTAYYWEEKLGFFAFPIILFLYILYFVLVMASIWQIYRCIQERFKDKLRLLTTAVLLLVVITTFFKPTGIIDYNRFEGKDLLIADREGGGNCTTILKLKDDSTFQKRNFCFGVSVTTGKYRVQHDTIFFHDVRLARHETEFYAFAVIAPLKPIRAGKNFDLMLYKSLKDTAGTGLKIKKNELIKRIAPQPDTSLVRNALIKPHDIYYQFYEKFGFTDLCTHYRTLYKSNGAESFTSWKKLPISNADLIHINKMPNKEDSLTNINFDVRFKKKDRFSDISLEMKEYYSEEKCNYILKMNRGYYYYDEKHLMIYDEDRQLFYEEVHECDE